MTKTNTQAAEFNVGDRVTATLPQTGEMPAVGTITAIKSGWFVIALDHPDLFPLVKKGIVSARKDRTAHLADTIESLTAPASAPAGSTLGMLQAANGTTPAASKPAPVRWPDVCPECGSGELEADDESCECPDCGWSEERSVEEALDEAEEHASKMAEALRKARVRYTKARRPSGAATAHCGDLIAKELLELEPIDVCRAADRALGTAIGFHETRYADLNPGQQRMNSGNKIRSAWRKATEAGDLQAALLIGTAIGLDSEEITDFMANLAESKAEASVDE